MEKSAPAVMLSKAMRQRIDRLADRLAHSGLSEKIHITPETVLMWALAKGVEDLEQAAEQRIH